jgi:hypothetical protein
VCSAAGLYLRISGAISATSPVFDYAKLAVLALAVLMMPVSLALTFAAIGIPLMQGDPRSFKVISKTREAEQARQGEQEREGEQAQGAALPRGRP